MQGAMGLPARTSEIERSASLDEERTTVEPRIEVHYSELLDSDLIHDDSDFTGPWCVDDGAGIRCMSTLEIWMALAAGNLAPDTRVWRDGRPCWLAIAEVEELTSEPDETLARELDESYPEISQVIVRRRASLLRAENQSERQPRATTRRINWSWRPRLPWTRWHAAGVLLGLVLSCVTASAVWFVNRPNPPAEALRVAPDIADRGRVLLDRAFEERARLRSVADNEASPRGFHSDAELRRSQREPR